MYKRQILRTLLSVFGVFRIRTVEFFLWFVGNTNNTSFPSNAFNDSFLIRCDSLLMKTYARFSSIASGEISTQSQVRPSSSPSRKEHEKDRFIASFNRSSSQTPVSYTHLDVYKRQQLDNMLFYAFVPIFQSNNC